MPRTYQSTINASGEFWIPSGSGLGSRFMVRMLHGATTADSPTMPLEVACPDALLSRRRDIELES